jgi:hypothetical protein
MLPYHSAHIFIRCYKFVLKHIDLKKIYIYDILCIPKPFIMCYGIPGRIRPGVEKNDPNQKSISLKIIILPCLIHHFMCFHI